MLALDELLKRLTSGRVGEWMVILHAFILVVLITMAVRPNPPIQIEWPRDEHGKEITTKAIEAKLQEIHRMNKTERDQLRDQIDEIANQLEEIDNEL